MTNSRHAPRLWLVRHGLTDSNAEGRIQGHSATDLNAVGREQAAQLAKYFATRTKARFSAIFSSDLPRALSTAKIIAAELELPVTTSPELRERALGQYEGKTSAEVRILRAKAVHGSPGTGDLADWTGVPGVESDDEVWSRTLAILDEISAAHTTPDAPRDILIVTHGGVIARVVFQTLGIPNTHKRRFTLANGVVTIVQFQGDDLFLLSHAELPLLFDGTSTPDTATVRRS
jgi:probable phosphoglycerate mutase